MKLTLLKNNRGQQEKCSVCGINLYEETGGRPAPKYMPCGINRKNLTEQELKEFSQNGITIEKVSCPFETNEEQRRNRQLHDIDSPGEGLILYDG